MRPPRRRRWTQRRLERPVAWLGVVAGTGLMSLAGSPHWWSTWVMGGLALAVVFANAAMLLLPLDDFDD